MSSHLNRNHGEADTFNNKQATSPAKIGANRYQNSSK